VSHEGAAVDDGNVDISPIDAADAAARAHGRERRRAKPKLDGVAEKQRLKQERLDAARDGEHGDQDLDDCRLGLSPIIRIEPDEIRVNDKAVFMLAQHEPGLFQRGQSLVRILPPSTKKDTGPRIGEVKRATLREMIASSRDVAKVQPAAGTLAPIASPGLVRRCGPCTRYVGGHPPPCGADRSADAPPGRLRSRRARLRPPQPSCSTRRLRVSSSCPCPRRRPAGMQCRHLWTSMR
jgi:hypothetical protein